METKIFARLTAWQNWIFTPAQRRPGPRARCAATAPGASAVFDRKRVVSAMTERSTTTPRSRTTSTSPTTGGCSGRWSRWQPKFMRLVGRDGPDAADPRRLPAHGGRRRPGGLGALRPRDDAATTAGASSWPSASPTGASRFGEHKGEPVWQEVPGEYRADLRRLIVDPGRHRAGVASSSSAGWALTAPSLYDLRNLFQVNVEEGRHLWAMVYLLHALLRPRRPRRGRRAAAAQLRQRRTPRASWARSTRRRPTGCRSSCSPTSPTATASTSSAR